jgi:hypothetical protein
MRREIPITQGPKRTVAMTQHGDTLGIFERVDKSSAWTFIEPEELAYIVLSASGRFQERYSAELERLQQGGS